MNVPDFIQIASIVVICYLFGMAIKLSPVDDKWIPLCVGIMGGVLGVAGMHLIPDFPYNNYMDAVACGIFSGLTATGINELITQPRKNK